MGMGTEAQKLVWEGAIPLQIHLHESEVTTLPPPPPALVLAPRIGYLPLLIPLIKPHFNCTLPPGVDTVWFDYKGLPLKWSTPTGALFDLLCAEPERPWNLTVHFRGYPTDILTPCDGEDCVKWSFINSLKEAAYIINGNCKNIMNMSQSDQLELWRCIIKGNMEGYLRISSKLKLGKFSDDFSSIPQKSIGESEANVGSRTGRVPVRLFVRKIGENHADLEDTSVIDSWDELSFINQAVELRKDGGGYFMLHDAVRSLIPDLFEDEPSIDDEIPKMERVDVSGIEKADSSLNGEDLEHPICTGNEASEEEPDRQKLQSSPRKTLIKVIRVQGIEPRWDIPFSWVVNNLMNPDFFLHICVFIAASMNETEETV